MKKILATLLVATMLLSCMSVISFAATSTLYTDEVFGTADLFGYTSSESLFGTTYTLNTLGAQYSTDAYAIVGNELANHPAAFTLMAAQMNGGLSVESNRTLLDNKKAEGTVKFSTGEIVAMPVYAGGDGVTNATISIDYDEEYLTIVDSKWFKFANLTNDNGWKANIADPNGLTGLIGIIYFKVNDVSGLTGDEAGNAVAHASFAIENANYSKDGVVTPATLENAEIDVNLQGLKAGTVAEKDPAAATDIADVVAFTGESEDYDADFDKITNIESGDSVEYSYAEWGVYQVYFATAVAATFKTPDEQGIQFTINDNEPVYKAANSKFVSAGQPFGILIFGMGSQSTVKAKAYAKYGEDYVLAD